MSCYVTSRTFAYNILCLFCILILIISIGFQVLVGSKDRVRLYNILQDKLKYFRETIQKSCRELRYSNGCQYWAGACAMTVVIYDSASFTQLVLFQGHMMAIRNLVWAPGDQVCRHVFRCLFAYLSISLIIYLFNYLVVQLLNLLII